LLFYRDAVKAQFWSFDVMFAMIIFVLTLLLLTFVWESISGELSIEYGGNLAHMQSQLQSLGSELLSTGTPPNWNTYINLNASNTWQNLSIGLGNGTASALSLAKINELTNMSQYDYQSSKTALGLAFDYYITFTCSSFSSSSCPGGATVSIGMDPAGLNATALQAVTLPVVVNGAAEQMQLVLWSNSTLSIE
jgi:hypothetical protein